MGRTSKLFYVFVGGLPFLYYVSLAGLFGVLVRLIVRFRKSSLDPIARNTLLLISALLLLSSSFAHDKGEAFLQLANFLPFFLLFAFVPVLLRTAIALEQLAMPILLTSIPINLIALGEYLLKNWDYPRSMRRLAIARWVRRAPDQGRAMVMFDQPNALACYLLLVLGLGLGLILYSRFKTASQSDRALLYSATFLNLLGIFCSGSRNGFLVAISQLVVFSLCVKVNRKLLITGLTSLGAIVVAAAVFGIGGRALSVGSWTHDPRVEIWRFAIDLIRDRPLLGWGLGNYKLLYDDLPISKAYPAFHPHNFWLLLGCETGLLVTIALTLLVGWICYRTVRRLMEGAIEPSYRAVLIGYCLAFWSCIAFSLLDVTFYDARINVLNWVILAALYAASSPAIEPPMRTQD
ncbi:O-antigen ligase family protein [Microcoleus sp. FACHB-1515]|uniref:O-antigen ligase family protein n=1 Tax=Cyanophyceae TaxID=3028117 RepID=UPI00168508E5|nr:O-antigen ligase family protein [Microcoleus sp. FACHB-1515]MBD2088479.1 O-antigen ligase family protein [Microcoleus sp. FACHB-1515]